MRWLVSLTALVALGLTVPVRGDPPPTKPAVSVSVEDWIERLASRDYRTRQAASAALLAKGPTALPALRQARGHPDAEVRRRVAVLIAALERDVALKPKRITLNLDHKPLADAITELARQSGYKIRPADGAGKGPQTPKSYTFHYEDLLFWEALDKVCEAGGLVPQLHAGQDTINLLPQDSYVPFKCYDGSFRLLATGFSYFRNVQFGQVPRNNLRVGRQGWESLSVNLTLAVEPRLPILRLGQVHLTRAEDDENHSLAPDDNSYLWGRWFGRRYYRMGMQRNFTMDTSVSLLTPSRTARSVKILSGTLSVTLLADEKPFVVTDNLAAAKGKKIKVGTATITIGDVSKIGSTQQQIHVGFTDEGSNNPYDFDGIYSVGQRLEIQDAKGEKIPFYSSFQSINWPCSCEMMLTTQPMAKSKVPAKLVYKVWTLLEHEVAFEFKDLPLP
jgi:hypothetical protein